MAIKELTKEFLGKSKAGWTWSRKRELWTTWQIDVHFNGERYIRRGFRTEADAKEHLEKIKLQEKLKEIGVVQLIKFPKIKELFDRHRQTLETNKQISTFDRVTKKFLALLTNPNLTIDELKRKHFKDFADARINDGIKPESANREIGDISAAIHKAGDYFENLENWSVPENLIYRPSFEPSERDRVITTDERTRLINHLLSEKRSSEREKDFLARRRTGLVFYFGLLTGLRHGEISGIEKINFDPAARRLRVKRFKTRKSGIRWTIFEPLTDTQAWVLSEAEKLYPQSEYFFSISGKNHNKIYEILKTNCNHLNIPYGKNSAGGFVLHDARHTFITVLEHGSVDSTTARSYSGHSKDSMLKRYAHATVDSRARAMQIIEKEIGLGDNGQDEKLKTIFEAVMSGEMSFENFKKSLKDSFTVF